MGKPAPEGSENTSGAGSTVVPSTNVPVLPRLLDIHGAAFYVSLSVGVIRDLVKAGHLRPVRVLLPAKPKKGRPERDLPGFRFDREDLDALVQTWKSRP